ncbi:MAG TPA: hypothetical protein VK497_05480 [Candidatus Saccharimonadales bacterium]|nr:hypothetical protein [Candidatus Saccharimonadales bacterium]
MLKESSPEFHQASTRAAGEGNVTSHETLASPEAISAAKAEVLALKEQIDNFQLQLDFLQTELNRVTPKENIFADIDPSTVAAEAARDFSHYKNVADITGYYNNDPSLIASEDVQKALADMTSELDSPLLGVQDTLPDSQEVNESQSTSEVLDQADSHKSSKGINNEAAVLYAHANQHAILVEELKNLALTDDRRKSLEAQRKEVEREFYKASREYKLQPGADIEADNVAWAHFKGEAASPEEVIKSTEATSADSIDSQGNEDRKTSAAELIDDDTPEPSESHPDIAPIDEDELIKSITENAQAHFIDDLLDNITEVRDQLRTSQTPELIKELAELEKDYNDKLSTYGKLSSEEGYDGQVLQYFNDRYKNIPAVDIQDTPKSPDAKSDALVEEEKLKAQTAVDDLNKLVDIISDLDLKRHQEEDSLEKAKLQERFDKAVAGYDNIMTEYYSSDYYDEDEAAKIAQHLNDALSPTQVATPSNNEPQPASTAPGAKQLLETLKKAYVQKSPKEWAKEGTINDNEEQYDFFDWTDEFVEQPIVETIQLAKNLRSKFSAAREAFRSKESRKESRKESARARAMGAASTLGTSVWNNLLWQTGKNGTKTLKEQERARQAAEAEAKANS